MDRLLRIFFVGIFYISICRVVIQITFGYGVVDLHSNPLYLLEAMKSVFFVSIVYLIVLCVVFNQSICKLLRHISFCTNNNTLNKLQPYEEVLQLDVTTKNIEKELSQLRTEVDEKNKYISELRGKLNLIVEDEKDASRDGVTSRIEDSAMVKTFRSLAKEHKSPSESRWEIFEGVFETFFPEFRQTLETHSKLSDGDFRVCALIWLHFAPSEIGWLLEMSKSNVSNRRRIALKVFGEDMPVASFDHRIRAISPMSR